MVKTDKFTVRCVWVTCTQHPYHVSFNINYRTMVHLKFSIINCKMYIFLLIIIIVWMYFLLYPKWPYRRLKIDSNHEYDYFDKLNSKNNHSFQNIWPNPKLCEVLLEIDDFLKQDSHVTNIFEQITVYWWFLNLIINK